MDMIYSILKKLGIFAARKVVVKHWNNLVERNKRNPDIIPCILRKMETSQFGKCLYWIINNKEFILTQHSYETLINPHLQNTKITKMPLDNIKNIINTSPNEITQVDASLSVILVDEQIVTANSSLISIFQNFCLLQKNNLDTNHSLYREIRDELRIRDIIITIEVSEKIKITNSICNLKATDFELPDRNLTFKIIK